MWVLQRGHSGDACDLASTLCKYDLREGDLFVLSRARVQQVRRGSISSALLMCGEGVRSILLVPLVARCIESIDVCIWSIFLNDCCSDCVGVYGNNCFVAAIVKNCGFLSLAVLKYVVCLCNICDGYCVFCLYCNVRCGSVGACAWDV